MWAVAFFGQEAALVNSEPMLFVRYGKSQISKSNALRKKRMRSNYQIDLPKSQHAANFALTLCADTPSKEFHPHAKRFEHP